MKTREQLMAEKYAESVADYPAESKERNNARERLRQANEDNPPPPTTHDRNAWRMERAAKRLAARRVKSHG